MALFTDGPVSCLPIELAELVTRRLPPAALRSLFRTSSTFGHLPTQELPTRLSVDVARLNPGSHGSHLPCGSGHLCRLASIRTLVLTRPRERDECYMSSYTPRDHLAHTMAFLLRSAPSMQRLTRLDLSGLPIVFAAAAATCLATSAPAGLSSLLLGRPPDEVDGIGRGMSRLWPALVGVATLRRLELRTPSRATWCLDGVGALTQLRALTVASAKVSLCRLAMPGLTELDLHCVQSVLDHDESYSNLAGFCGLRDLRLAAGCDHVSCATLQGLTHLAVQDHICLRPLHVSAYKALVSLTAVRARFQCELLLPGLPCLEDLVAYILVLPPAGAGVQSSTLRRLDVGLLGDHGVRTPPQNVALTFPRLASLSLVYVSEPSMQPHCWPEGLEGHLLHLCTLSCFESSLSLPLAQAALAVSRLELSVHRSDDPGSMPCLQALRQFAPRLREVTLEGWLPSEGMLALVGLWPHLVGVAYVDMNVDDACVAVLGDLPGLRRLSLLRCPSITALGISALAHRSLVELIIVRGCGMVTETGVNRVMREVGRPQLTIDLM